MASLAVHYTLGTVSVALPPEKQMDSNLNRLKRLDLLSGFGAGVLGAGLALVFAQWFEPFAIPILLIGILTHGWAMFAKSKLESQAMMEQPKWTVVAEWVCWTMLVGLSAYVGYALLS